MSFALHCGYSDGILQSRNKTLMSCMVTTILTDCELYKTGAGDNDDDDDNDDVDDDDSDDAAAAAAADDGSN